MSALPVSNSDRRINPRTSVNTIVVYKLAGDISYSMGSMRDISLTGALINIDQKLEMDSHVNLVIAASEDDALIKISADIIRTAEPCGELAYSYGCLILDVEKI